MTSAHRLFGWIVVALLALGPTVAAANCIPVAQRGLPAARVMPASFSTAALNADEAQLTFLGHASFLIESPAGVRIVTDYNDYIGAPSLPDIVTMNNAHSTHFTNAPDPRVKHVLRGWGTEQKPAHHDLRERDVRVRNVSTNVRDFNGSTRYNGNSIFIYEVAALCIAHLGHLHHVLSKENLAELGQVDILMLPIDGAFTMGQQDMAEVLDQLRPQLILPMHYFSPGNLNRFLDRMRTTYKVSQREKPVLTVSRATLPTSPEIIVLPGR